MALVEDTATDGTPPSPEALIPEAWEHRRRRRRRQWGAVLLGLVILAGGGMVLFGGGGGGSVVPTVGGPLPVGIVARATDPAGGLPWGIRIVRTSGWTCLQLGRLRGDQLGVIDEDGSFGNTGRFHPFGPSTTNQARCAPDDRDGHAFMTIELGSEAASGAGGGYQGVSGCRPASEVARMRQVLARIRRLRGRPIVLPTPTVCPPGDLRFIQYGLLGPDATSVIYTYDRRPEVEPTHGVDGAYLVVGPATPRFCAQLPRYSFCGSTGDAPNSIFGGMILSARYRSGRTCQPAGLDTRLPAMVVQCPRVGYIAPRPTVRDSLLTAPVSVRVVPARRYCWKPESRPVYGFGTAAASDLGNYLPCNGALPARDEHPGLVEHGLLVVFSWTARQPVTSANTEYEYFLGSGSCGGEGGSTSGRITAGERLTRGIVVQSGCRGRVTGAVGYEPDLGPGGGGFAGADPGHDGSLLVGSFTITIPPRDSRP
jgi:hypothetical protein